MMAINIQDKNCMCKMMRSRRRSQPRRSRKRCYGRTACVRCSDDESSDEMAERQRKVDAALAELASAGKPEEEYSPPSPELPADATVAVAGSSTMIGQRLLRAINAAGFNAVEVDANAESIAADTSALVIISAAAGGKGGVRHTDGLNPRAFGSSRASHPVASRAS